MRFIFGVLVGYSMRGKEKSGIIILATIAFIVYIVVPTIIFSGALIALSLDVHHERHSRPVLTKVPSIKGLSYEDAESKLRASNLNIRLLATRYDLRLQPGLIIDQVPQTGDEVVYGYPVGVTVTDANPDSRMVNSVSATLVTQKNDSGLRGRRSF
jgi:beta-lactam-binding protein with PASTA domain